MPVDNQQNAVELRGVRVAFGNSVILRGIDLDVPAGSTTAVLGANGSGKSTLIRAAVGIVPYSGSISLFGANVASKRSVPWGRIGYTPQRMSATAGVPATALEVVESGLVYGLRMRPPRGARVQAMAALAAVELDHRAHESVQTFSGGQQQRVLIARALVRDPDLLVLDEPFAGVDRASREAITQVLAERRAEGLTILVVLHEIHDLEALIDETVVIDHGVIVHRGGPPRPAEGHDDPQHDHHHGQPPLTYRVPHLGKDLGFKPARDRE